MLIFASNDLSKYFMLLDVPLDLIHIVSYGSNHSLFIFLVRGGMNKLDGFKYIQKLTLCGINHNNTRSTDIKTFYDTVLSRLYIYTM